MYKFTQKTINSIKYTQGYIDASKEIISEKKIEMEELIRKQRAADETARGVEAMTGQRPHEIYEYVYALGSQIDDLGKEIANLNEVIKGYRKVIRQEKIMAAEWDAERQYKTASAQGTSVKCPFSEKYLAKAWNDEMCRLFRYGRVAVA